MQKSVVILGAAVLVAGVVAGGLWQNLRAERAHNRELAAQAAAMPPAPPVAPVEQPVMPVPVEPEAPAAAAPAAAAVVKKAEPAPSPAAAAAPPPADAANALAALNSPQGQDMMRTMMRSVMAQMYPDLAEEMDFTPEEASKFLDMLAEQMGSMGADSLGLLGGGQADPAAMQETQRKLLEQQEASEARIAATLGSKYPKWQEYQGTAAARQQVTQLGASLSAAGQPLTEAQTKSLTAALATATVETQREEREWAAGPGKNSQNLMLESVQRAADAQLKMVDVAAPHLNAQQLALYKREVEQQVKMIGAVMGLLGGQGGAAGQGQGQATAPAGR
jgi:hypothetical protein